MEWLLIGVFFAACWVVNRWAFKKDVERVIKAEEERIWKPALADRAGGDLSGGPRCKTP